MMDRMRRALAGCAAALALGMAGTAAAAPRPPAARPPNVIVILADDLGWPDVSTYGRTSVPTPNIDRIARTGVAFSNGYVAASVCAVSRAGLLTGRSPQRFGFQYNLEDQRDQQQGLPLAERTMADRLKALGYRTAAVGKWHQGFAPAFYPLQRGFDEFYGFLAGETIYADPATPGIVTTPTKADRPINYDKPSGWTVTGPDRARVHNEHAYLTTDLTDRAIDYIDRAGAGGDPFFLYLAYNAPHWPMQAPQAAYDRFAGIQDPVRRTYVAMISALDDSVGRVLDELERKGQRDNTLIVFLSDNGCPEQFGFCDCTHPLGSGKFTYVEGGPKVPMMLSWPAGLKPQGVVATPVSSLDILPTVLDAADPKAPRPRALEGRDLVAIASGRDRADDRTLYWGQDPVFAARSGRWKLWKSTDLKQTRLFDLDADPWERNDLAATHPDVVARLDAGLEAWRKTFAPPLWPVHTVRQADACGRRTEWVH